MNHIIHPSDFSYLFRKHAFNFTKISFVARQELTKKINVVEMELWRFTSMIFSWDSFLTSSFLLRTENWGEKENNFFSEFNREELRKFFIFMNYSNFGRIRKLRRENHNFFEFFRNKISILIYLKSWNLTNWLFKIKY